MDTVLFSGERPFQCNQCQFRAITKDNLKRHIEREHDNVKYVCQECGYVAPSRTTLWHHSQKHKTKYMIVCPLCNERFDR